MRLFELLTMITVLVTFMVISWPARKRPIWRIGLAITAILFILIHLAVEGYRWQMVPSYVLVVILAGVSAGQLTEKSPRPVFPRKRIPGLMSVGVGLLFLTAAITLPLVLPVFVLPEPSGPYAVGGTILRLVDENRLETLTVDPNDKREVLVQAWYPAQSAGDAVPAPYWSDAHSFGSQLAGLFGLPEFLFDHLALVQTHTYPDLPLATGPTCLSGHPLLTGLLPRFCLPKHRPNGRTGQPRIHRV